MTKSSEFVCAVCNSNGESDGLMRSLEFMNQFLVNLCVCVLYSRHLYMNFSLTRCLTTSARFLWYFKYWLFRVWPLSIFVVILQNREVFFKMIEEGTADAWMCRIWWMDVEVVDTEICNDISIWHKKQLCIVDTSSCVTTRMSIPESVRCFKSTEGNMTNSAADLPEK